MAKGKQSDVQLTELTEKKIPKEVTDPSTGKKIKVTQDMIAAAINAERQITGAFEQIALALVQIRDLKLYLLSGFETMSEYLEKRFAFSERFGYQLMKYADVFGDSKYFPQIMQQPRKLLEIAANNDDLKQQLKDGEVTLHDGTRLTLKELKKELANELVAELERTKTDLKAAKKDAREHRQLAEEQSKTILNYEESMGEDAFKKITKKKEILSTLFAMDAQAAEMIKTLDAIESEDPEVVARLEAVLTAILAGASQTQNKWMHLLLSTQPDKN